MNKMLSEKLKGVIIVLLSLVILLLLYLFGFLRYVPKIENPYHFGPHNGWVIFSIHFPIGLILFLISILVVFYIILFMIRKRVNIKWFIWYAPIPIMTILFVILSAWISFNTQY